MATVEARCTQCASREYGSAEQNNNSYEYRVFSSQLDHGTGQEHGTELLNCPSCEEKTVHNRCGRSVPSGGR
jgi:hypothetical protein